ncbi:MAG: hypothetical protein HC893_15930 [Chloroflexaceae bacterium]|nr:hypothetical protein [Chloroflexaceae bacterium]
MLPALLNFITPAHEPFVVMTAALFGIDPLLAYQNIGAALAASFLPIVYVVLYRTFRLAPCTALAATCLAVVFLVSDGNGLYAFGNWLLGRIWQGKAIANALLMPTTVILAWRFLLRPTRCHFLLVVLAAFARRA